MTTTLRQLRLLYGLVRGISGILLLATVSRPTTAFEIQSRSELGYRYYITQDSRYREFDDRNRELFPGHRLALSMDNEVPLTERSRLFLEVTGNIFLARLSDEFFKMDKIRYLIAPGLRVTHGRHTGSFALSHECIHNIDRLTGGGSVFWTLAYLEINTDGAEIHNLATRSTDPSPTLQHAVDYRLGAGIYLQGDSAAYITQKNDLQNYGKILLRYSISVRGRPVLFTDWTQELWKTETVNAHYKGTVRINWIVPNRGSTLILNTGYTYLDQNRYNNEHSLWSIGFSFLH